MSTIPIANRGFAATTVDRLGTPGGIGGWGLKSDTHRC